MTHRVRDMLRALDAQKTAYQQEVQALEREQATLRSDLETVTHDRDKAWAHLTAAVVPRLDSPKLDVAAARIGLRSVSAGALQARMDEERRRIAAQLGAAEADERWTNREAIANEASIRLQELDEAIKPLSDSIALLDEEPLFSELMRAGYGADGYTQRFWQLSYYRHWKHGDLIVERHGARLGVQDFAGIRAKYQAEQHALRSLRESQLQWRNARKEAEDLEKTVIRLRADQESLVPRTLAWARGQVREHLGALDQAEVARMLAPDEELRIAAARVFGTEAKRQYLEKMMDELVAAPLKDLRAAMDKNVRDMSKLNRPKNAHRTFSAADYERRFGKDRKAAWRKRRQRIQETRTRIVSFGHYDRWSPTSDFLWWDVMTDGQLDGNFIPEVRDRVTHHHSHDHAAVASSFARDDLVRDIS